MTQFIQLHVLTSYPPSNLNRDDMGRPKTARMGNTERLRISSQSLKRHWRTSDVFEQALAGHLGTRTKRLGHDIYEKLLQGGLKDKEASDIASTIAGQFGKVSTKRVHEIEQLVHISPNEQQAINDLVNQVIQNKAKPADADLVLLKKDNMAVDIALFGRMLASKPEQNIDAACQVAHAISVQQIVIEDDYFTAVDDLQNPDDSAGAAHIGESNFASAVFYEYICINKDLLVENLNGDTALAEKALAALTEAIATVSPSGKQNSFASRAFASFILAEKGAEQPRSLSVAFLKAINTENVLPDAIDSLVAHQQKFNQVYGTTNQDYQMDVEHGRGTLKGLQDFVAKS